VRFCDKLSDHPTIVFASTYLLDYSQTLAAWPSVEARPPSFFGHFSFRPSALFAPTRGGSVMWPHRCSGWDLYLISVWRSDPLERRGSLAYSASRLFFDLKSTSS